MRKALILLAPVSLLVLAACSENAEEAADGASFEQPVLNEAVADAAAADAAAGAEEAAASAADSELAALAGVPDIPFTLPRMAYAFDYGFRLAGADIAPLQQRHADMCEALGSYNCQIVSLSRSGEEEDEVVGELQLAVVADKARGFANLLSAAAEQADAEHFRANITGEDLSKSIVDTEARLRSRIALRDRLMAVLETRSGKVEELVEAERGVAAVNEEIDQAQSWLAEQRGRVAYSRMTLSYESATPGASFLEPVEGALGSLGAIFGGLVAVLIVLGALALPVLAALLGVKALRRRARPVAEA